MASTRRVFFRNGALALVGTSALPAFLSRAVMASETTPGSFKNKRLVVIFQRGAADGLNIVVPHAESSYYAMRPSINIPRKAVLELDGFFGLHPSMDSLLPLWKEKHLAIVHAAGSTDTTRSHFDAQDYMESGTPGLKATADGWLNRALETVPEESASPFRAVAMGPNLPRMLHGSAPAIALPDLKQFKGMAQAPGTGQIVEGGFEAMYSQTVDHALHGTGTETFEAIDLLRKADPSKYQPENSAQYPTSRLGQSLQQIGQLFKADIGVEVLFVDCCGLDNHVNESRPQGQQYQLHQDPGHGLCG